MISHLSLRGGRSRSLLATPPQPLGVPRGKHVCTVCGLDDCLCGFWITFKTPQPPLRSAVYAVRWLTAVTTGAKPTQAGVVESAGQILIIECTSGPERLETISGTWILPLVLPRYGSLISELVGRKPFIFFFLCFALRGEAILQWSSHMSRSHILQGINAFAAIFLMVSGKASQCCFFSSGSSGGNPALYKTADSDTSLYIRVP